MTACVLLWAAALLGATSVAFGAAPEAQVAHGSYLVSRVAMCVECHTPRDANGELDRARLLRGAPIPVRSPFPNQAWAFSAPAISGLPGWIDQDAIALLTTGRRLSGYMPKRPMPTFRLSREDAAAVIAYLRSLR
jgi:mono/diheme cytochrome c family protein